MHKRTVTYLNGGQSASRPDVAPFAGFILLLIFPFMLLGKMKQPATGVVTDEQLPFAHQEGMCSARGAFGAVIGLNKDGRLSFAMPELPQAWQATVITRVAAHHGIKLNTLQLVALHELPYLATDIRELPQVLALPASQHGDLLQSGSYSALTASQFLDCLTEMHDLLTAKNQHCYIGVKTDATASVPQVFALIGLLQSQGINRFSLMTQREDWSKPDWLLYSSRVEYSIQNPRP
jgi:hypothetical protein